MKDITQFTCVREQRTDVAHFHSQLCMRKLSSGLHFIEESTIVVLFTFLNLILGKPFISSYSNLNMNPGYSYKKSGKKINV